MKKATKQINKKATNEISDADASFIRQVFKNLSSVTFSTNKMQDARAKALYRVIVDVEGASTHRRIEYLKNGAKRLLREADAIFKSKDSKGKSHKSIGGKYVRLHPEDPYDHRLVMVKDKGRVRERTIEQYDNYETIEQDFDEEGNVVDYGTRSFAQRSRDDAINEYYGYDLWDFLKAKNIYGDLTQYNISEGWYIENGQKHYFDEKNIK